MTSPASPSSLYDVLRTLASFGSLVLVVWGWYAVNRQNNARERRKEVRQLTDRTLKIAADAVELAMKFHGGKTDEHTGLEVEGWKLTLAFRNLSSQMALMRAVPVNIDSCAAPFLRLKFVVTGDDFMTSKWKPWAAKDPRWMELLDASNKFSHSLDRAFFECFKV